MYPGFPEKHFAVPGLRHSARQPAYRKDEDMEIERKWIVDGWPDMDFPVTAVHAMRQGYISTDPTVRIREESEKDGSLSWILCFKSHGGIARKEIEIEITQEQFLQLEDLTGLPLIPKERRTYLLPDGMHLEVNHVDEGQPTEFWYAEIEYVSVHQAEQWDPSTLGLEKYLSRDVTGQSGQTMAAYWIRTRKPACQEK